MDTVRNESVGAGVEGTSALGNGNSLFTFYKPLPAGSYVYVYNHFGPAAPHMMKFRGESTLSLYEPEGLVFLDRILVGLVAAMIYLVGQAVIWGRSQRKQIAVQPAQ
jgi:hypothetical protein